MDQITELRMPDFRYRGYNIHDRISEVNIMSKSEKKKSQNMYKAILSLKDLKECQEFFEDICSMSELYSMEQRYEVAEMLQEEKVYTEIMKETGASSATVSRVKRMLFYGTGCLDRIMKRLKSEDSE